MKADKPFEEVQVSDAAVWRWVREDDIYVNRMTQEHMNQFKNDIEQAILHEREACAALCDDLAGQVGNKNFIAVDQRQFCAKQIRARGEK
jgi:predicted site-specific integrase-resolvase